MRITWDPKSEEEVEILVNGLYVGTCRFVAGKWTLDIRPVLYESLKEKTKRSGYMGITMYSEPNIPEFKSDLNAGNWLADAWVHEFGEP